MGRAPTYAATWDTTRCPDAERLAAFIDGPPLSRCSQVERHLSECDACRGILIAVMLTPPATLPAAETIH